MNLEKLDNLSGREKLLLVLAFLCLFGWLTDLVIVKAIVRKSREMDAAIANAGKERELSRAILARKGDVTREYEKNSGLVGKAASSAEAINGLKGEIYDLAKETGVKIHAMDQRETRRLTYCVEYMVEVGKFEADLNNLLMFLHKVASSPGGVLRVVRLNVAPGKTSPAVSGSLLIAKVMVSEAEAERQAGGKGKAAEAESKGTVKKK